ncbi:hypothetical protein AAG570_007846 [Ranatra chinensis]|uniref:Uncharacterized protein n=1 Tax=Ranatra chinensis TaxID=642074 RepID=A0ABD0Y6A5_9HEMI
MLCLTDIPLKHLSLVPDKETGSCSGEESGRRALGASSGSSSLFILWQVLCSPLDPGAALSSDILTHVVLSLIRILGGRRRRSSSQTGPGSVPRRGGERPPSEPI